MHSTKLPIIPELAKLIETNQKRRKKSKLKVKKSPRLFWLRIKRSLSLPSFDLDVKNEFTKKMIDDLDG